MIPATIWQHNTGNFTAPSQYDCSTFPVSLLHDLSNNLAASQHNTWILLGNCSYVTGKLLRSCLSDPIHQNLTKLNFLSWHQTQHIQLTFLTWLHGRWHKQYLRSPPEELHLAWVDVIFLGDFSCLSWASIMCNQAEILICWCQSLRQ